MMMSLRRTIRTNESVIVAKLFIIFGVTFRGTIDSCENKKKGAVEQSKMQLKLGIFPNLMVTLKLSMIFLLMSIKLSKIIYG